MARVIIAIQLTQFRIGVFNCFVVSSFRFVSLPGTCTPVVNLEIGFNIHQRGTAGSNRQAAEFKLRLAAAHTRPYCIMAKKTKAEKQADLASIMELYFATSLAMQEETNLLDDTEMDDDFLADKDADSEFFEALGIQTMREVQEMSGDGQRGTYGDRPKNNWFSTSLSSPPLEFRRIFRCVLCWYFQTNLIGFI
jgi:hypothetical protein